MKSYKQLEREREAKAEALGQGSWLNPTTMEWCVTDVTFYPKTKLWITEQGKRREITLLELKANYKKLEL